MVKNIGFVFEEHNSRDEYTIAARGLKKTSCAEEYIEVFIFDIG